MSTVQLSPKVIASFASAPTAGANTGAILRVGSNLFYDVGTSLVAIDGSNLVQASEAMAAGDFGYVYDDGSGNYRVRRSDGSSTNKIPCNCFVPTAVASGSSVLVFYFGLNGYCSGLTPGERFISATTPGGTVSATTAAGYSGGQLVQRVGVATTATTLAFSPGQVVQTA